MTRETLQADCACLHWRLVIFTPLSQCISCAKLQGQAAFAVGQPQEAASKELLRKIWCSKVVLQLLIVRVLCVADPVSAWHAWAMAVSPGDSTT